MLGFDAIGSDALGSQEDDDATVIVVVPPDPPQPPPPDPEFEEWLNDPNAIRVVLAEIGARSGGVEITRYLATGIYVTEGGEVPAHQNYLSRLVAEDISTVEKLSLEGQASMTIGEIGIENRGGELDEWLLDVWTNRSVTLFLGDPRWSRASFRQVFSGVIASELSSKSREVLSLKVRDKLQRLNGAVSEEKLGGETTNKEALLPQLFGEVHNLTPLLTDPAQLEYQVHSGPVERIIEVRDNGIPVTITPNLAAGKFKLNQSPAGAVTVSAQGDKVGGYSNTVTKLVQRLVTGYGKIESERFTAADLDTANLASFDYNHPAPVGLPLSDRTNVIAACQQLTGSLGAQMMISREGKLQLYQLDLRNLVPSFDIHPQHMLEKNLSLVSRQDVKGAVKLGFCKSWTVQPGLVTSLSAADKELFATEWLTTTQTDDNVINTYRLTGEPVQEDTLLLCRADAEAEAMRRLDLNKAPRTVFRFEGLSQMMNLRLGQHVRLHHPRFNLAAGAAGVVVSLSTKWAKGRVTVEVLI